MVIKKLLKFKLKEALVGGFFVIIGLLGLLSVPVLNSATVYAVPEAEGTLDGGSGIPGKDDCSDTVGPVSWIVCTTTETVAKATDKLYDVINQFLEVNPILIKNDSSVHKIWEYIKGLTNIIFIIFVLVVVYSQITGLGISNYGIKKALPKLIVTAVLVNISFVICQVAVDASNIIGDSLRGWLTSVIENPDVAIDWNSINGSTTWASMYSAAAGLSVVAVGGIALSFTTGSIWMVIPAVLGAVVAVLTGLATIALRQAVVALLVMISPLAMVANVLPNTEQWFKKWKDLFFKMLIFYPAFSLLFGASAVAGYAIMLSAAETGNVIGYVVGAMVQAFPLFFSWKLMKMSGTFLGGINAKLNSLAAGGLAKNRAWAESRRDLTKARSLERGIMPSAYLMNFMNRRKVAREEETKEIEAGLKARYLAQSDAKDYNKNGDLTKRGQRRYKRQALANRYQQFSLMHQDNMNEGFGKHGDEFKGRIAEMRGGVLSSTGNYSAVINGSTYVDRIRELDKVNTDAGDDLKFEKARAANIEFENAQGFKKRTDDAINAHFDQKAIEEGNRFRKMSGAMNDENLARYERMKGIVNSANTDLSAHIAAADAAHTFAAHANVMQGKFGSYFKLTAPTQELVNRISELTKRADSSSYIDPIIAGLRELNVRGDTDLVGKQIEEILKDKKLKLGTYASQSLASFLMFDVKGSDPTLRRFGKYINVETAAMYNEQEDEESLKNNTRRRDYVTLYEYVNGEYEDPDEKVFDERTGQKEKSKKPKMCAKEMLKGTSFKDMERTALANMYNILQKHSVDKNGEFDLDKFMKNEKAFWDTIMPNILSDHYSWLSGSEQIMTFGKRLTGVDSSKHSFDFEGIVGKDAASRLDDNAKKKLMDAAVERTKKFLGAQVPVQIARTKSDVLSAVLDQGNLLALRDDDDASDELRNSVYSGKKIPDKKLDENGVEYDYYKALVGSKYKGKVSENFRESFNKRSLEGFAKMYDKGFQGEAKDNLVEGLGGPGYLRSLLSKSKSSNDVSDDDGPMIDEYTEETTGGGGPSYSGARIRLNALDRRMSVEEFWGQAREILQESAHGDDTKYMNYFENMDRLIAGNHYSDSTVLYDDIINGIFGGHS